MRSRQRAEHRRPGATQERRVQAESERGGEPTILRRATIGTLLGGAARNFGATARAAAADLVAAGARATELVGDQIIDRERQDAVLRVSVLVLADEHGPLCRPEDIGPALDRADAIFRAEAGIRLRVVDITVLAEPAPVAALDPRANQRLLLDDVLGVTQPYRRHLPPQGAVAGPVTVVVVRDIAGRTTGCSLGMTADWVICQRSLFDAGNPTGYDETVLAHELAHALNLPHHRDPQNLMYPSSSPPDHVRGTGLRAWQRQVLHANRHTVPGPERPADHRRVVR